MADLTLPPFVPPPLVYRLNLWALPEEDSADETEVGGFVLPLHIILPPVRCS